MFYWSIYRLSANYVLPSTYFTKDELSKIQSTSHSAMISRMGYCRTTPREIIFGSKYYGGVGLFHLYDDQGYGQLKTFIKFWRSPSTQAGKLLRILLSWCQYCVGTKAAVLQDVHSIWPHFESRWISSLRQYLSTTSGQLELNNSDTAMHRRFHDAHIMDVALTCGRFKAATIRRINYCRMYLNVLVLSDIVMPCGTRFDPAAYEGTKALYFTNPNHQVHQEKPGWKSWKTWRKLLNILCKPKRRLYLSQPLGPWQVPSLHLSENWPFIIDPTTNTVYQRAGTEFTLHNRITYNYDKDSSSSVDALPVTAVPVFAITRPSTISVSPNISAPMASPPPQVLTTFGTYLDQAASWERHLFATLEFNQPEQRVWTILSQEPCLCASDGSAPHHQGGFAWVISNQQGEQLARCSGPAFGHKISSYLAESYGILSLLLFFHTMNQTHSDKPKCSQQCHSIYCDNEGLVTTLTKYSTYSHIYPNLTVSPEWDTIAQINETLKQLTPQQPLIVHISGHQDDRTPYEALSLPAQLNCDADALASKYLIDNPRIDHQFVPLLPKAECLLHLPQGTITRDYSQELRNTRTDNAFQKRMCTKNGWDPSDLKSIDWNAHAQALRKQEHRRSTFVKYIHDLLPLGRRVHRYNPKYPPCCPSCQEPNEDLKHFWTCPAPTRIAWRNNFLSSLKQRLLELRTVKHVRNSLLDRVQSILHGTHPTMTSAEPHLVTLSQAQEAIGWEQILKGIFSSLWNTHIVLKSQRQAHTNWTAEVIDCIFQHWWLLWEMRNQDQHGCDTLTQAQASTLQAHRELQQLYDTSTNQSHLKNFNGSLLLISALVPNGLPINFGNGSTHGSQLYQRKPTHHGHQLTRRITPFKQPWRLDNAATWRAWLLPYLITPQNHPDYSPP